MFRVLKNDHGSSFTAIGLQEYDAMNFMISRWLLWQDCKIGSQQLHFLSSELGVYFDLGCKQARIKTVLVLLDTLTNPQMVYIRITSQRVFKRFPSAIVTAPKRTIPKKYQ